MKRLGLPLALALVLVSVGFVSSAAAARRCGRVYVPDGRASAKVRVVRGSDSCGAARRLVRAAFTAERRRHWDGTGQLGIYWGVAGFRCYIGLGGSQTFCFRGGRRVDGSFRR